MGFRISPARNRSEVIHLSCETWHLDLLARRCRCHRQMHSPSLVFSSEESVLVPMDKSFVQVLGPYNKQYSSRSPATSEFLACFGPIFCGARGCGSVDPARVTSSHCVSSIHLECLLAFERSIPQPRNPCVACRALSGGRSR